MAQLLGNMGIGAVIKFKVNGLDRKFLIINQGKPSSSIYDDSCNGTWILMQDIYAKRLWKSGDNNDYATSGIHTYLNSTFPGLIETNMRNAIKQVKIPFRPGAGTSSIVYSGSSGLSSKVFLLSNYEVGLTKSDHTYSVIDGEKVSYFDAGTAPSAKTGRIAKLDGVADSWWLRSPVTTGETAVWHILNDGATSSSVTSTQLGMRPAMVLPQDLLVSDLPDENGVYSLVWEIFVNLRTTSIGISTNGTVLTADSPVIATNGFSGGQDDKEPVLKMFPQFFDPFRNLDIRLNTTKISKATIKGAVGDSTTVITGKTDKPLEVGDKLWTGSENEILDLEGSFSEHTVEDATVTDQVYTTEGNGGRKLVQLDNGWLVAGVLSKTVKAVFYKSEDNGLTWSMLFEFPSNIGDIAMASKGTIVYVLRTFGTTQINLSTFDATISTGFSESVTVDNTQTALGNVSLAINEAKSELHACWSSKNSTYANSFNIRYAKGTINQDGSVTWGVIEQVTTRNTSGADHKKPSIIVGQDGNPVIVHDFYSGSLSYILRNVYGTSSWGSASSGAMMLYDGGSYIQSSPSAIFVPSGINGLPNGRLWAVWHGKDSENGSWDNIMVAYSDDGGVTWNVTKLTTGSVFQNRYPSICGNLDGQIFVLYEKTDQVSVTGIDMQMHDTNWGSPITIRNGGNYVSTLGDLLDFSIPLFIFKGTGRVGFYGTWTVDEGYTLEMQHPCTLADGQQVPIIDLQVSQRDTEIPLHSIESNQLNYRLETSDVVVDLTVEGKGTEISSLVYAIS